MGNQKKQPKPKPAEKHTIPYIKAKNHQNCIINGAFGGLNLKQNIDVHLYWEKLAAPDHSELKTHSEGENQIRIESHDNITPEGASLGIIREIMVSLSLRPDYAYSIGEWLMRRAEDAGVKVRRKSEEAKKSGNR